MSLAGITAQLVPSQMSSEYAAIGGTKKVSALKKFMSSSRGRKESKSK